MTLEEDTDEDDGMLQVEGLTVVIDKALLETRAPFTVGYEGGQFAVVGKE